MPTDFYSNTPPRIMGKEFELRPTVGITSATLKPDASIRVAGPCVDAGMTTWFTLFSMHDEVGGHIEVRTPEALGPKQLIIASALARSAFVDTLRESLKTHNHEEERAPNAVYFHAGSYDHRPSTDRQKHGKLQRRGFHLNMIGPAMSPERCQDLLSILDTYSATASWTGAGMLGPNGFCLIQKSRRTKYNASTSVQGMREGLVAIHTADTIANDSVTKGWIRIERRIGDAVRSVCAEFADAAAMSLMTRIVEHWDIFSSQQKQELKGILLKNAARSLKTVAEDLSLQKTLPCRDGKRRTAVNIQQVLLKYARMIVNTFDAPEDEKQGLAIWQNLVDITARTNPLNDEISEAARSIHWAARLGYLMLKYDVPAEKLTGTNPKQNSQSLCLDLIYPIDPMAKFEERTTAGITDPVILQDHTHTKPSGTRAEARAELLKRHADPDDPLIIKSVSWNNVRVIHPDRLGNPKVWDIALHPYNPAIPEMASWTMVRTRGSIMQTRKL